MKRGIAVVSVLLACAASAGAGYWTGFREAWTLGLVADSLPRGVLATGQLESMKTGKPELVKVLLESEIDAGLVRAEWIFDHPLRRILNPLSGTNVYPEYEQYAIRLANYRKRNPSPLDVRQQDPTREDTSEKQEAARQVQREIDDAVAARNRNIERYATEK